MLERGQDVPHFDVLTTGGVPVTYAEAAWQRANLVLVTLRAGDDPDGRAYADAVTARVAAIPDTLCVVTMEPVEGLPAPGALVADRWGAIAFAACGRDVAGLPSADELADWVEYVRRECPECQGEAK
jgi:hypothetical protein